MEKEAFKKALEKAESLGYDRGVKTVFISLLTLMEKEPLKNLSWDNIKRLSEDLNVIAPTGNSL